MEDKNHSAMNNKEENHDLNKNNQPLESMLVMNSDEEEESQEDHNIPLIDASNKCKTKLEDNLTPISIGKIIIFKPRRVKKTLFKKCFTFLLSLIVFVLLIKYGIKFISHFASNSHLHLREKLYCDQVVPTFIWNQTFPMLTIESPLRLVDVNNDTVLDIIAVFGTGVDSIYYRSIVCQMYFNQSESDENGCGGGIMALDGKSGKTMWTRYTPHELFAPNCNLDINDDGIKDCIVGGKMASLYAFSGANGELIWSIPLAVEGVIAESLSFYTPLYIPKDVDGDDLPDIVVMHGGSQLKRTIERIPARILVVSSRKGAILSWNLVPDGAGSLYAPQLLTRPDGTSLILFGTGDESHPGSLYFISFTDLIQGKMNKAVMIYTDCCKGVMTPPVMIDINGDQVLDIIMSLFNSTVVAFDGMTFQILWKTEFAGGETLSAPSVGFFNNDSTPDFAITYNYGPGYPIYLKSQFIILNGKNGNQLSNPTNMLVGTQSSPLSISTQSNNDIFIHWYSSCTNVTNATSLDDKSSKLKFLPHTTVPDIKRTDFCKLRFNSTTFHQLRVITSTSTSIIFDSRDLKLDELYINYTAIGQNWIDRRMKSDEDNLDVVGANERQFTPSAYQRGSQIQDSQQDNSYQDPQYEQIAPQFSYDRPRYRPSNNRYKRKVDNKKYPDGLFKVASIGTLSPSLSTKGNTIDLIFATYWFPSSPNARLMTSEMDSCMSKYMSSNEARRLRLGSNALFKQVQYDPDAYEEAVKDICLSETNQVDATSSNHNALLKEMGSMSIFRVNIKCESISQLKGYKKVSRIKEYKEQIWPSYMGKSGDCIANVKII